MKEKTVNRISRWDLPVVLGISVLIMLIQTRFDSHVFLTDDNAIQFYPVIDKVYRGFLQSGRLAFYDFFQMKGMIIGDEGYYCQTNILMFFSWGLSKCLLRSSDCITIYGVVCTAAGNWGWNELFRRMKISFSKRMLVIAMATSVSAFVWFGYWFYAFNSYIVIPVLLLLIYRILTVGNKQDYYLCGLLLFFSLTLGNVQYTVYHYMAFALIICFYMIIMRRYDKMRYLFSNVLIGAILSMPILLSQLNASVRRKEFIYADDFFAGRVSFIRWIFNALLPASILKESPILRGLSAYGNYHQQFMPGVVIFCCIFMKYLLKKILKGLKEKESIVNCRKKYAKDDKNVFVVCTFLCTVFFGLFQCGKGYFVADVISHIPMINQFRLLYKLSLVIAPLSMVVVAFVMERKWNIARWGAIASVVLGIYNNRFITAGHGFWMYEDDMKNMVSGMDAYDELRLEMNQNGIDLVNYRMLGMSSEDDPFGNDHFDALFIGANYPTLFGYFSLGGYEIALMKENYDSISGIFKGYVHDYAISGQAKIGELIWLTDDGQIYYYSDFVPQMKRNAVKYCLFRENSKEQYLFRQLLIELYGIAPEVIKLSDGFCVYVLESEKICNGAEVEMNGMIDQLTFRVDDDYQGEFLTMKFSYNENLVAYLLDGRQNKEILIVPDGNGDMKIAYEDAMRGKQVVIRYGRFIDQLLMYYGMIGSFASLVGMIIWIRSYRKIQEMEI